MKTKSRKKTQYYTLRRGLKDGLPIGLGYLSVSFGFGIAVVAQGFSPLFALLISMTNETSAGQLAGLEIMARYGGFLEMALCQLVINMRYALMGISLSQHVDESFTTPWRMLLSFSITDEIYAVASTKSHKVGTKYFSGLAIPPYVGWALGTILGAVAGQLLPPVVTSSLGVMLYGMFIAIVVPPARDNRGVLFASLAAVLLSCVLYYVPLFDFITNGFAVIICAVSVSALAAWLFPVRDDDENEVGSEVGGQDTDSQNDTGEVAS